MLKKAVILLKDTKGDGYINAAIYILIAVMCGAFLLSVFGAQTYRMNTEDIADYSVRQISKDGQFSGHTISDLIGVAGNGRYKITYENGAGSKTYSIDRSNTSLPVDKLREGDSFTVTISEIKDNKIGIGGISSSKVNTSATASGVGERWWKP